MKTWFHLAIVILFFFSFDLFAQDRIKLINGEWAPYLSRNLPHFGAASHIVREAFSAVGVDRIWILSKKLEINKTLLKRFNKGLGIIRENGKYSEIIDSLDRGGYDKN